MSCLWLFCNKMYDPLEMNGDMGYLILTGEECINSMKNNPLHILLPQTNESNGPPK